MEEGVYSCRMYRTQRCGRHRWKLHCAEHRGPEICNSSLGIDRVSLLLPLLPCLTRVDTTQTDRIYSSLLWWLLSRCIFTSLTKLKREGQGCLRKRYVPLFIGGPANANLKVGGLPFHILNAQIRVSPKLESAEYGQLERIGRTDWDREPSYPVLIIATV